MDEPAPTKLVEDVLGLLEDAKIPQGINDRVAMLVEAGEMIRDETIDRSDGMGVTLSASHGNFIRRAAEDIQCDADLQRFMRAAANWIADNFGDAHIEYHDSTGWRAGICSEDEWHTGDGSIEGAMAAFILANRPPSMEPSEA